MQKLAVDEYLDFLDLPKIDILSRTGLLKPLEAIASIYREIETLEVVHTRGLSKKPYTTASDKKSTLERQKHREACAGDVKLLKDAIGLCEQCNADPVVAPNVQTACSRLFASIGILTTALRQRRDKFQRLVQQNLRREKEKLDELNLKNGEYGAGSRFIFAGKGVMKSFEEGVQFLAANGSSLSERIVGAADLLQCVPYVSWPLFKNMVLEGAGTKEEVKLLKDLVLDALPVILVDHRVILNCSRADLYP